MATQTNQTMHYDPRTKQMLAYSKSQINIVTTPTFKRSLNPHYLEKSASYVNVSIETYTSSLNNRETSRMATSKFIGQIFAKQYGAIVNADNTNKIVITCGEHNDLG